MIQLYLLPKWHSSYLNVIFKITVFPPVFYLSPLSGSKSPIGGLFLRLHIILQWLCDYSCAIITLFLAATSRATRCGWFPHTSLFQSSCSCVFVFHINFAVSLNLATETDVLLFVLELHYVCILN